MIEEGNSDGSFKEEKKNAGSSDGSSNSGDANDRWNEELMNELEFSNVFVDDIDDHLPEYFEVKKVKQETGTQCKLCEEGFDGDLRTKTNCSRCGARVCALCC